MEGRTRRQPRRSCQVIFYAILLIVIVGFSAWYFVSHPGMLSSLLHREQARPEPAATVQVVTQPTRVSVAPTKPAVAPEPTTKVVAPVVVAPTEPSVPVQPTTEVVVRPPVTGVCPPENTFVYPLDAWLTYYPVIVAAMEGWMAQDGYCLELYPYGIADNYPDVKEVERFSKVASGEWDAMPTTWDGFVRFAKEGEMVLVALLDESDKGDMLIVAPEIQRLDQLADPMNPVYPGRPVRIAYSDGSVSQFLLETFRHWFWWGKFGRPDIEKVPKPDTEAAVNAFTANEVDGVLTWYPNSIDALDGRPGAHVPPGADTGTFRVVVDILAFSQKTINENRPMVDSFWRAFARGHKMMADNPAQATADITAWEQSFGIDTDDPDQKWTWANSPEEMSAEWFDTSLAPATMRQNAWAMRDFATRGAHSLVVQRYKEIQEIWRSAGVTIPEVDPVTMVDPSFALTLAGDSAYEQTTPWPNSTFLLTEGWHPDPLSFEELAKLPVIADLPFNRVQFAGDGYQLTQEDINSILKYIVGPVKLTRGRLEVIASGWYWALGYTVEYVEKWVDDQRYGLGVKQALIGLGLRESVFFYGGHVSPNEMPVLTGLSPDVQELVRLTYRPGRQPDLTGLSPAEQEAVKAAYRYVIFRLHLERER